MPPRLPRFPTPGLRRPSLLLASALLPLLPLSARANSATWQGFGNTSAWSNPFNWAGNLFPALGVNTDVITFTGNLRVTPNEDFGPDFPLASLIFDANASSFILGGGKLDFFANATIHQNSPFLQTINENIAVQSNLTIDGTGNLLINGAIDSAGNSYLATTLVKNGTNTLFLASPNTFNGIVNLNAGFISLKDPNALQNALVAINTNNGLALNGNSNVTLSALSGNGSLNLGISNLTLTPSLTSTYAGTLSSSNTSLTINGAAAGIQRLSGSNSSIGTVTVSQGTLDIAAGSMNITLSGGIAVANSAAAIVEGAANVSANTNVVVDGTAASLLLRGSGTTLSSSFQTLVGVGSNGTISVQSNAILNCGTFGLAGASLGGNGSFSVSSGGKMFDTDGILGYSNGSIGSATLTGPGSAWSNSHNLGVGGYTEGFNGGTGTLTISNGATVSAVGTTTIWTANSSISVNNATLTTGLLAGTNSFGNISLIDPASGSALNINASSGVAVYAGVISGTGSLIKSGLSSQILAGSNAFTGNVTINAGILEMATGSASHYHVAAGTLILDFSNVSNSFFQADPSALIVYNTPVLQGGSLLGPGTHNVYAVSSFNNTIFANNVNISLAANVTLSGVSNFGTLTSSGSIVVSSAILNDGAINGNLFILSSASAFGNGIYGSVNIAAGGTFQPGEISGPQANGATISSLAGAGTIDNFFSINPVTLIIHGPSNSTFSGDIRNSAGALGLSLQNGAALTLTGNANTYAGPTAIDPTSFLTISAPGALSPNSPIANNGTLSINANSTASRITGLGVLNLAANTTLTLTPGAGPSQQNNIFLSNGSLLNLANNTLILEAPALPAARQADMTQLAVWIQSARNNGLWNGPGISSTTVAADPAHLSLALADNATLGLTAFADIPLDANSIFITPALLGDANLNGKVDLADLSILLNHFGQTTPAWTSGNFDNAQTINLTDLAYVLNNFGATNPNASNIFAPSTQSVPTPEPASLSLLACAATLLLRIRRRPIAV